MTERIGFELEPVAPFRLDLTVWVLRRRFDNITDRWDGQTYRRVSVGEDGMPYEIAVSQAGTLQTPHLHISLVGNSLDAEVQSRATGALSRLLGIDLNLGKFYGQVTNDHHLGPLANQFLGFKPPRFLTYFETLINAIACQQISLTLGIRLLNRLVECCGPVLQTEAGAFHAFPRPQDLAGMDVEELRKMGFSYQKARYMTGLARLIVENKFTFAGLEGMDDAEAVLRLRTLKGVGRWTAEYFLLRGLGRTHIFPADDVGARSHLGRWLALPSPLTYEEVHRALKPWEGFGGLVYFHLLLKSLRDNGTLTGGKELPC